MLTIRGILSQGGNCGASITLSNTQSVGSPHAASLGRRSHPRFDILRGFEVVVEDYTLCSIVWIQRLVSLNMRVMGQGNSLKGGDGRIEVAVGRKLTLYP